MKHAEHAEQKALMQWAAVQSLPPADDIEPGAKLADYLFAIPNGGRRNVLEAVRLKSEGVRAGVSDLYLPLARGGQHGLWIELKATKGRATQSQLAWIAKMQRAGYAAEVCYGWRHAQATICAYLGQAKKCLTQHAS